MRAELWNSERVRLSLLAVLVALVAWLVFVLGTGVIYWPDPACAANSCSASSLITRNPYCLIDPTCASPLLKAGYNGQHAFVASWQGLAWLANFGDPTWVVAPDNLVETFSFLNFALFVALYLAIATGVGRLARDSVQEFGLAFFSAWYLFEVIRWFGTYLALSERYALRTFREAMTYAVMALALLPLAVTVVSPTARRGRQ